MKLFIAFLCAAAGFTVQWKEQWLPAPPSAESIAWKPHRSWFHNYKNLATETVRADAEYWTKLLCFLLVVAFAVAIGFGAK